MGYIDRDLMESEHVIYRTRLHWNIFIWPTVWFIAGLALLGFGTNRKAIDTREAMFGAGGFFILIAIFIFFPRFIRYMSSDFGITNRRVIMKVGILRRRSLEVLLNKVESVLVRQSAFGTVPRFGSITVTGTGGTKDTFHNVSGPVEFRKKIEEQIVSIAGFSKQMNKGGGPPA